VIKESSVGLDAEEAVNADMMLSSFHIDDDTLEIFRFEAFDSLSEGSHDGMCHPWNRLKMTNNNEDFDVLR